MSNSSKKRFNIIDFIIIVVVIGCIAGLVMRFNIIDRITGITESEEKTVSFIARELSPEVADCIEEKDEFYCVSPELSLGALYTLEKNQSKKVYSDTEGKARVFEDASEIDISGSFRVKGFDSENGFMIGGTYYTAPGKEMIIHSENVQISVIITEIS